MMQKQDPIVLSERRQVSHRLTWLQCMESLFVRVRICMHWQSNCLYITPNPISHFKYIKSQTNLNLKLRESSEAVCVCSLKMASYEKQYGETPTDEYGNPIRRTDEYGNPLGHHTTTTGTTAATTGAGGYAPHDFAATTAAGQGQGVHGHDYDRKEHHGVTGAVLHRSGSSSSSSVSPLFYFLLIYQIMGI